MSIIFQLIVSSAIPAGALDYTKVNERKLFAALVELSYGFRDIYWTDDGTDTGVALFGDEPPWVECLGTEPDKRLWSQQQMWGGIIPPVISWGDGSYSIQTENAGSNRWYTRLKVAGRAESNFNDGRQRGVRAFCLQALGTD